MISQLCLAREIKGTDTNINYYRLDAFRVVESLKGTESTDVSQGKSFTWPQALLPFQSSEAVMHLDSFLKRLAGKNVSEMTHFVSSGQKRLTQSINQLSCRFGRHVRTWSWWWRSCWRSRAWSLPWTGCWHCTSACARATMHAGVRRGNASVVYVDDDLTLTTTQSSARLFRSSWPDTDRYYSSHTVNCGIVFLHTHTHTPV